MKIILLAAVFPDQWLKYANEEFSGGWGESIFQRAKVGCILNTSKTPPLRPRRRPHPKPSTPHDAA